MNDLDRLHMLQSELMNSDVRSTEGVGSLADSIESVYSVLDSKSDDLVNCFSELWAALEIIAVNNQEKGTMPTKKEVEDLSRMKSNLSSAIDREISRRG